MAAPPTRNSSPRTLLADPAAAKRREREFDASGCCEPFERVQLGNHVVVLVS